MYELNCTEYEILPGPQYPQYLAQFCLAHFSYGGAHAALPYSSQSPKLSIHGLPIRISYYKKYLEYIAFLCQL